MAGNTEAVIHLYCLDELSPYAAQLYDLAWRLIMGQDKKTDRRRGIYVFVKWSVSRYRGLQFGMVQREGQKVVRRRAWVSQSIPLRGSRDPWAWSFFNLQYAVHEMSHVYDDHRKMNGRPLRHTYRVPWGSRPQEIRAIKTSQRAAWQLVHSRRARRDFRRLVELGRPLYFNPYRGNGHDRHQIAGRLRTGRRPMAT